MVAHMPGSNHDLRGDVLNDRFYMAGGLTAEYGYPMQSHAYSELFEFDAEENKWRVVADLGHQRIYCATGVLKGNLWVVGGDIIHLQGKRTTTRLSQKVDPKKGEVENTIPLNVDLSAPLAFNLQERLYVLGYKNGLGDKEMPLYVASIADGDKQWREEPLGPLGRGAIYGSLHQGRISIVVANKYLAMLDPVKGKWDTVELPLKVRSPQVASLHDELWLMGGRDIENQALVQVYNTKNKQWRNGPDLPRELAWGVGFTLKGNLYVTGGAAGSSYNNRTFRLKRK
jgi:hypothetical protein